MMRIRLPFAGGFFVLLVFAGYLGLSTLNLDTLVNDKILHFLIFFLLTVVFYWIIDTNRRRTLNLTLAVCTFGLGVGSEFVQGFLPNDRNFDPWDIVGNLVGSLTGLALCSWYHKRMLERRRERKAYTAVAGEDIGDGDGAVGTGLDGLTETDEDNGIDHGIGFGFGGTRVHDIELAERPVAKNTELSSEVVPAAVQSIVPTTTTGNGSTSTVKKPTLEEEVDNWDENADEAWDEADVGERLPEAESTPAPAPKKHVD